MISLSDRILDNQAGDFVKRNKPKWLRAKMPGGPGYAETRSIIDRHNLHTVCESAKCPNLGECWSRRTATIMILGDVCTRSCGFCHIKTGKPPILDTDEPRRVGEAAGLMKLRHLVITSVNRDELPDGGAAIWAESIREIRRNSPETSVEVLIPDFCGDWDALQVVLDERPEILNHNMESVKRLYGVVRPQAKYQRSIELLRRSKEQGLTTKTGIMVGIGENDDEIIELFEDLIEGTRTAEGCCDILTIGQYLQPTRNHLPISRWVTPDQFLRYKQVGQAMGIRHVESGPMVRSSYHAEDQVLHLEDAPERPTDGAATGVAGVAGLPADQTG
ncbi:MAG: lipoyl synthase [Phycisphaeraceae bacterium]|nr:lipoyl synthase [Phycisphaeraceae bacterium]